MTTSKRSSVVIGASEATGMSRPLVQVTLDLTGRTHLRLIGILPGLAQSAALPEQVPTLVERNFHRAQALMLLGFVDLVMLHLGAELSLLGDELVDLGENVTVLVHQPSVPD